MFCGLTEGCMNVGYVRTDGGPPLILYNYIRSSPTAVDLRTPGVQEEVAHSVTQTVARRLSCSISHADDFEKIVFEHLRIAVPSFTCMRFLFLAV